MGSAGRSAAARWTSLCGAIGVALLVIVIVAGYIGPDSAVDNLAPTFIMITFWVGLVFASLLFGDVFRAFNPWRAIGRATGAVLGRRAPVPRPYPEAARPLAGGRRAGVLRLDRAGGEVGRASRARSSPPRSATRSSRSPRRRSGERRRGSDGARRSRSTSTCSRGCQPVRDARPRRRRATAARRAAAAGPGAGDRRVRHRDDRDRHVRRAEPGARSGRTCSPTSSTLFTSLGVARTARRSSRTPSGCCSASG